MNQPARRIRFGAFELDPLSGDLWRDGRRRALQSQPLAILRALLERPGEVVKREDLHRLLWADQEYGDFEHGLNAAIKRLRDAVGDDADLPRYIETVPRRGYRLIAAVENPPDAAPPSAQPPPPSPTQPVSRRSRWRSAASAATLIGFIGIGAVAFRGWYSGGLDSVERGLAASSLHELTQVTYDSGWTTDPTVSPDGHSVAYASDRGGDGNLSIWVQELSGGLPRQLTHQSSSDREPAYSPDGSHIAFRSERDGGGIYTIPAHTGGREERLVAGGHEPRYSPDGRFIAYWTGAPQTDTCDPAFNKVFIVPSLGGTPTAISPHLMGGCWPVWTPDSKHLLLTTGRPGEMLRWLVVPIDGGDPVDTGLVDVTMRQGFLCAPRQQVLTRDRLVFSVSREGPTNLWVTSIDPTTWKTRGPAVQLTNGPESHVVASLSMNGQLFVASYSQKASLWTLPLSTRDGRSKPPLLRLTAGVQIDRLPTISKDGAIVAFSRLFGEQQAIYALDAKTGTQTMKVPSSMSMSYPSVSPDGSRIAYRRGAALEMVGAGGQEQIAAPCSCEPQGWSRDNSRLLYDDQTAGDSQISVLNLGTGEKRVLAARKGHQLYQGRFSPDERWVTFVDVVLDRQRIWLARIPTTGATDPANWIAITGGDSFDDKPRWSADGGLLYFISLRDGFKCIWAQRIDLGSRRPVGDAYAVYHLHSARESLSNALTSDLGFDVSRDRLVFNMSELVGNIWMTEPSPKR